MDLEASLSECVLACGTCRYRQCRYRQGRYGQGKQCREGHVQGRREQAPAASGTTEILKV